MDTYFKTVFAVIQQACLTENVQVNGLVMIVELTTFTLKHQMCFTMDDLKQAFNAWLVSNLWFVHSRICILYNVTKVRSLDMLIQ